VNVAERFAENLVRERKRAGFSQEEIGWRANLHRTEISQLERGLRVARIDTLAKLAGALELEPAQLLNGIAWEAGTRRLGHFEIPDPDASL
jgi:transcriptional regulator with XRE-family HTH domain